MNNDFITIRSFETPHYLAPSGWAAHIPFAFELIHKLKPAILVELGVYHGSSYFSFCQAVRDEKLPTLCYGIDTWQGDEHASFYTEEIFNKVTAYNKANYADFSYLLRSDFNDALVSFRDKSIDLLHIDGLHTYEAVKNDFESWFPKLSDSSIVLFHDIAVKDRGFGVFQLWEELSATYPSFSFEHGNGLGLLATGRNISPDILPLFHFPEPQIAEIRTIYHRLGESFDAQLKIEQLQQSVAEFKAAQARILQLQQEVEELGAWGTRSAKELEEAIARSNHDNFLKDAELDTLRQNLAQQRTYSFDMDKFTDEIASLVSTLSQSSGTPPRTRLSASPEDPALKKLRLEIDQLQKNITWYQNTYEHRSFLGLLRQKIADKFGK
jgi:O-antigen biosynthesis protein